MCRGAQLVLVLVLVLEYFNSPSQEDAGRLVERTCVSLFVRLRCEVGHPVLSSSLSQRLSEEFSCEGVAIGAFVRCVLCACEMPDT